ncbi:MAG: rhodanese-like domain-containing protein [bacterium]
MRRNLLSELLMVLWLTGCNDSGDISAKEVKLLMENGRLKEVILLDVRRPEEYAAGHISGSLSMPLNSLEERIGELDQARPVIVYCQSGKSGCSRSQRACRLLKEQGFKRVKDMAGGINEWRRIGGKIEGSGQAEETGQTKMPVWELGHGCED